MKCLKPVIAVSSVALTCLLGTGCSSSSDYSEKLASEVRSDPTPSLDTLSQRRTDMDNAIAVTEDENWRMFNQDLGRFWLLDRPSLLTPEPLPR